MRLASALALVLISGLASHVHGQSLGNAGTVDGTVIDPSGASVGNATVTLHSPVTNYKQSITTGPAGTFHFVNIPPHPYHLEVSASGFSTYTQDITIRNSVPISVKATLALAGATTTLDVEGAGADLLETDPSAHTDADRNLLLKLPVSDPGGGLSQAIVYTTGGVAADGNGSFHPLGDHSQVSFVIDGQPISDQQSKVFSTQLPTGAIQGMELTTGTPDAEFGDKTSLVAQITTRSGLGAKHVFGNIDSSYGNFGTAGAGGAIGFGTAQVGNFLAVDGVRSGRFLDTPEFTPFHDKGNNETIFDRFDLQPDSNDVFHLNVFVARNWIQIPNSYDQLAQDQHQRVLTWSIAPGYQRIVNPHVLVTVNPYFRKDQFYYYASRDPFADTPATQNQSRQLLNYGVKADVSISSAGNNFKFGVDLKRTRLTEAFSFGITDPAFNSVCVNQSGVAAGPASIVDPAGCAKAGLVSNPDFSVGLLPFDLTRGGSPFAFNGRAYVNQYGFYLQDSITMGHFQFTPGFRADSYNGPSHGTGVEPRLGIAYNIKKTGSVLRVAYARTFETPFNENLLLSSATGAGGLAGNVFGSDSVPIKPGRRNQFNMGLQQSLGKFILIDADYFWKFTNGAYDFSTLLNTTITFPISWHNSKLDGITGRVSTTNLHGFQAYFTFGHTRARYFPPEVGGLVSQGAPLAGGVFRIDHDQAFQSTGVFRYQHKTAEWISFTWRFDSGGVVSGIPDSNAALALTAAQQTSIGLACGNVLATFGKPITSCSGTLTSALMTLPPAGTENDDHNPDRVKPRNIFNLGLGSDNLFHTEKREKLTASIEIENLANKMALYNFLSTFSGTHFLQPRTVVAHLGYTF